jgi:hypothetical protein
MTLSQHVREFLDAMEADGFHRADELAPLMLKFALSENSLDIEAGDKIRTAMRRRELTLRGRARLVVAILQQHLATFPAEH